ncbi:MAG: hypothetical protein DMG59_26935 [Acidobacteria bacterium]|nr:MAG: hypothetical protein DMG59_26935 [Acidobacteriota bacterium]
MDRRCLAQLHLLSQIFVPMNHSARLVGFRLECKELTATLPDSSDGNRNNAAMAGRAASDALNLVFQEIDGCQLSWQITFSRSHVVTPEGGLTAISPLLSTFCPQRKAKVAREASPRPCRRMINP